MHGKNISSLFLKPWESRCNLTKEETQSSLVEAGLIAESKKWKKEMAFNMGRRYTKIWQVSGWDFYGLYIHFLM